MIIRYMVNGRMDSAYMCCSIDAVMLLLALHRAGCSVTWWQSEECTLNHGACPQSVHKCTAKSRKKQGERQHTKRVQNTPGFHVRKSNAKVTQKTGGKH